MPKTPRSKALAILRTHSADHRKERDYRKIEQAMMSLDGVSSASINHVGGTISIKFDPEKVSFEQICERIKQC